MVAPALRSPWALQCLSSAWLHHCRNLLPKPASVKLEMRAAAEAPEEMRIGRYEMVKEILAPGEYFVGDLVVFKQPSRGHAAFTQFLRKNSANDIGKPAR